MYEEFFGLQRRPFASIPAVDQYYPGTAIENARQALLRCIQRASGVGMVVGPAGTGKTLLCQLLAEEFKSQFEVAMLCAGRLSTRRALLQAILHELGQPFRGMDEGELRLALIDHLTLGEDRPNGLVLLVDEAHTLPLKLFEEIRMLTNVVLGGQPGVRVAVAGGPSLEERLASPKLEAFSQRLAARCYLEPFSRSETQDYIRAQLRKAGGRDEHAMADDACTAVFQATGGIPRLVNQLCDHALVMALARGRRRVEAPCIEEAWADLQQLPAPPANQPCASVASAVIEFGTLDDEPEEDQPALATAGRPMAEPAEMLLSAPGNASKEETPTGLPSDDAEADLSAGLSSPPSDTGDDGADDEPLERLDQIEQALAEMDDDFQPAGSTGPEVELVFGQPSDPFAERFQEEELIVDAYASKAQPSPAPARGGPRRPGAEPREWMADAEYAAPGRDRTLELNRAASLQQAAPAPASLVPQRLDAEGPETLPMHREADAVPVCGPDAGMIVVEEGYEDARPAPERPIIPVRRQEYRQLFARLRRG